MRYSENDSYTSPRHPHNRKNTDIFSRSPSVQHIFPDGCLGILQHCKWIFSLDFMTLEAWQTYFYLSFCNIGCWTVVQMERVEDSRLARHTQLVSSNNRCDLWSVIVFIATRGWANGCHVGNSTPGANGETWTSNVTPTIPGRTSSTGEWIINFESSISDLYLREFFLFFFSSACTEHGARLCRASCRSRNAVGRARCQRTPTAP